VSACPQVGPERGLAERRGILAAFGQIPQTFVLGFGYEHVGLPVEIQALN
jgi:hypothetical protein